VAKWLSQGHYPCFALTETGRTVLQSDLGGPGTNFQRKEFPRVYLRTAFHTSKGSSTPFVHVCNLQGIPVHSANRLQRWSATILGYDFMMEYGKSMDFGQADAPSRLITSNSAPDEEVVAALQADFDMGVLTCYLPATFDKVCSITEKVVLL